MRNPPPCRPHGLRLAQPRGWSPGRLTEDAADEDRTDEAEGSLVAKVDSVRAHSDLYRRSASTLGFVPTIEDEQRHRAERKEDAAGVRTNCGGPAESCGLEITRNPPGRPHRLRLAQTRGGPQAANPNLQRHRSPPIPTAPMDPMISGTLGTARPAGARRAKLVRITNTLKINNTM